MYSNYLKKLIFASHKKYKYIVLFFRSPDLTSSTGNSSSTPNFSQNTQYYPSNDALDSTDKEIDFPSAKRIKLSSNKGLIWN